MNVEVNIKDMNELVTKFEDYLRQERMHQPNTIKSYVKVLNDFIGFLSEEHGENILALEAMGKKNLLSFMKSGSPTRKVTSRHTWNIRLSALRSFYDLLFKQELIMVNPAMKIDRLKIQNREPIPLSMDEVFRLVEVMKKASPLYQNRNVAIIKVLFHCAFRVAELVSLNIDQVDFDNYIFMNVHTKGRKYLSVPFNNVVAEALRIYLGDRTRMKPSENEPALFLSDRRNRLSSRTVQELIGNYGKKAGISRTVTPHLLRHSSATQFVNIGTPLGVVQEICGHASVKTTERYIHFNGSEKRKAINKLGIIWNQYIQQEGG